MLYFPKNYRLLLLFSYTIFSCKFKKEPTLFQQLKPGESGIHFSNRITENDTMNIISFEYIYNGGGVALGDFNNDDKIDVFFTGNQVENKLYLNQGFSAEEPPHFKDISKNANIGGEGKWCTGATAVDINADGLLDIYASASIKKVASERANLLYINQGLNKNGEPTFKNMAQEYGIADTTHTTNSVFFDYDNDSDLDLYVLVDEMADINFPNNYHKKITDGSSRITDRLYRNDFDLKLGHPFFTNVSKTEGITIEGFGLGVNICDVNKDGWKDIYVTNDYITNDLLYINQHKNGKHIGFSDMADQYFKHTSHSAMGNDVEDINNDGLPDFFAVDMMPADNYRKKTMIMANNYQATQNNDKFGYTYQYPRNTLQLNRGVDFKTGQPTFSEIGLLAGLAQTDWSWTPMVTDFDNDGLKDVIITNGFPKDVTDLDFMAYRSSTGNYATPMYLMDFIPSVKLKNFAFKNNGNLKFNEVSESWGITEPSFSNGAAYADLDNDGDLDYVINNINDSASVFINNTRQLFSEKSNYLEVKFKGIKPNINGIGAVVEIFYNKTEKQIYDATPYRGYLSTVEQVAHFGLGKHNLIEKLIVKWPNGKSQVLPNLKANQTIILNESNATFQESNNENPKPNSYFKDVSDQLKINYFHEEEDAIDFNIQKLIPHKFSQNGPCLAVGDINGDKLDDVFIGGSLGRKGKFLVQNINEKFILKDLLPGNDGLEKQIEDSDALFIDFDKDGDNDLYIVAGSNEAKEGSEAYQDQLFINDGKGNFSKSINILPKFLKSGSCVRASDYDHDGDVDLFIGTKLIPNEYPKPATSYILRNDYPNKTFTDITQKIAPDLISIGLIYDATWADFDGDGWQDLVLAGEWIPVTFLKNDKGAFKIVNESTGISNYLGFWNCITTADFDKDGDMDFVVGNLGENTLHQPTNDYPSRIFAGDFNNDKNYDAIPTIYFKNKKNEKLEFAYNSRDDLIKQFIQTRARFKNYAEFGEATIDKILTPSEQKSALVLKVNWVKTSYIENLGKGKFAIKELPTTAQFSKAQKILSLDANSDGNLDIIISGNDYGNELAVGRLDASKGVLLLGNGKGNFREVSLTDSGLNLDGDSKDLVKLNNANGKVLLINTVNRGRLRFYKLK